MRLLLAGILLVVSAAARAADLPTITELPAAAGDATLVLPVRSAAYLPARGADPGATIELAKDDLSLTCRRLAATATSGTVGYPIHSSDIPEVDRISRMMGSSFVKSIACDEGDVATAADGFVQATGKLTLVADAARRAFDAADRRLYEVTAPIVLASGWGSYGAGQDAYEAACLAMKAATTDTSTVFSYCEAPAVKISCCGNASLTGAFHALVFAYATPAFVGATLTAPTALEANAKAQTYLSEQKTKLADGAAFAFCTPASWEYAPVMAFQAKCQVLQHAYKPAFTETLRCQAAASAENGQNAVWARVTELDGVVSFGWILKSPRAYSASHNTAVYAADGSSVAMGEDDKAARLTAAGIDLRVRRDGDFPAVLTGLDNGPGGRGNPASVALTCAFR